MNRTRRCTLVLLRLVLIGSKDLDGGETPDAILAAQSLVLVRIDGAHLDDTLKVVRGKISSRSAGASFTSFVICLSSFRDEVEPAIIIIFFIQL